MVVIVVKSVCTAYGYNMIHEDVQVEKNSPCFDFILLFFSSLCLWKAVPVRRGDAHMNHTYFACVNARPVSYFFLLSLFASLYCVMIPFCHYA